MKTKSVSPSALRKMLKSGKVVFQFTKKNGEVRTAVGTLKSDLITIPVGHGTCPPKEAGYSIYFDLEKNAFRCYDESKLIGVVC